MNAMTYATIRHNLVKTMEHVCQNHEPVIITRHKKQAVVMLSLEDYQSLAETAYLLRSSNNAQRLLEAMAELDSGKGIERELIEE